MEIKFEDRDEYLRKPIAEKIIKLLSSDAKVSPFIIDGGWGAGKTEFCSKLINFVRDQDPVPFKAVYVDAFKADHADQPLMTLLAAVLTVVPEKEAVPLVKQALPALRFVLRTGGKAAIAWLLKQDLIDLGEDLEKAIGQAGEAAVDHAVEKMLQDHQQAEKSIQALKGVLAEVAKDTPIVLFIDELDRCRPDFAVSMLEVIKHFFDVERVSVVLITNAEQLKAAINHCYGGGVDAQRYLDKFVGFSCLLPGYLKRQNKKDMKLVSFIHFDALVKNSSILKGKALSDSKLLFFVEELVGAHRMSLREVERFVKYLEIYQSLAGGDGFSDEEPHGFAILRVYAVYCYIFYPDVAKQFLTGQYDPIEILKSIARDDMPYNPDGKGYSPLDMITVMLVSQFKNLPSHFYKVDGIYAREWEEIISVAFGGRALFGGFPYLSRCAEIISGVCLCFSLTAD